MAVRAVIESREPPWRRSEWHGRAGGYCGWRVTPDGVLREGHSAVERTKGDPTTLRRIASDYGEPIQLWADLFDVEPRMLGAVIATESGGRPHAERAEPSIRDASIGLTQHLTATAGEVYRLLPTTHPGRPLLPTSLRTTKSLPDGGDLSRWQAILRNPSTSIGLAAALLNHHDVHLELQRDPVLLYCAYNAGGVYEDDSDPWGLRNYDPDGPGPRPGALDHFTRWYGDACAVIG